jgi:hypothetical protein
VLQRCGQVKTTGSAPKLSQIFDESSIRANHPFRIKTPINTYFEEKLPHYHRSTAFYNFTGQFIEKYLAVTFNGIYLFI